MGRFRRLEGHRRRGLCGVTKREGEGIEERL